jgi:hypothetical protein
MSVLTSFSLSLPLFLHTSSITVTANLQALAAVPQGKAAEQERAMQERANADKRQLVTIVLSIAGTFPASRSSPSSYMVVVVTISIKPSIRLGVTLSQKEEI